MKRTKAATPPASIAQRSGCMQLAELWRGAWPFLPALLVGTLLRVYQLGDQILADDEWHAIHACAGASYGYIATHFGSADYSIPLTLLYKLAADTVGLSEWVMRAPVLAVGVLSLLSFPWLVQRLCDRTTALLFGWLLALSPMHIYFSRYARPYVISLFLVFHGLLALYLFWQTREARYKKLYVACAVLGPYFHLSVLPILLAPPCVGVALQWLYERRQPGSQPAGAPSLTRELLQLCGWTFAGCALLLGPPLLGNLSALTEKTHQGTLNAASFAQALQLWVGFRSAPLLAGLWVLLAVGAAGLWRRQRRLAGFVAAVAAWQLLVLLITRPTALEFPIVVARYGLALLPLLLLLTAAGLRTLGAQVGRFFRPAALALFAAWLLVSLQQGPLRSTYYAPNSWTNHALFQYYPDLSAQHNPYAQLAPARLSAYYEQLGRLPAGSLRVLEAPWYYQWDFNAYPFYQQVSHQGMAIGFVRRGGESAAEGGELTRPDPRFRFFNQVYAGDMAGICARGIDQVIFHKDLRAELGHPSLPNLDAEVAALIQTYATTYGPPLFTDEQIVVFDVASRCQAGQGR